MTRLLLIATLLGCGASATDVSCTAYEKVVELCQQLPTQCPWSQGSE